MNIHAFGCSHVFGHEHTQYIFDDPFEEFKKATGDTTLQIDTGGIVKSSSYDVNQLGNAWDNYVIEYCKDNNLDFKEESNKTSYVKYFSEFFSFFLIFVCDDKEILVLRILDLR